MIWRSSVSSFPIQRRSGRGKSRWSMRPYFIGSDAWDPPRNTLLFLIMQIRNYQWYAYVIWFLIQREESSAKFVVDFNGRLSDSTCSWLDEVCEHQLYTAVHPYQGTFPWPITDWIGQFHPTFLLSSSKLYSFHRILPHDPVTIYREMLIWMTSVARTRYFIYPFNLVRFIFMDQHMIYYLVFFFFYIYIWD